MILSRKRVEQVIDGDRLGSFIKEIVLARPGGEPARPTSIGVESGRAADRRGDVPLAMVRKRGLDTATKGALLLVHGYGQNRYAWHLPSRSLVNFLAADGYDVFNLDLRGHGRSRHLGARPPKDLTEYVREDVPAAVAEVIKLSGHERVFLVGHSLGGLISYAAAPVLGDRVAGVITLGSPYHFTRGSRFLSLFGSAMLALDRTWSIEHHNVPLKQAGELMRLLRVVAESPLLPLPIRGYAPGSLESRVLGEHMSLAMDIGSIAVVRNLFLRAAEARASGHRLGVLYGYASGFEALDVPLLVIAGSADALAPPEAVRPAYERSSSSDKSYRVFPRGHIDILVGRDAPLTIWPLLLSWLNTRVRRELTRASA
jgi:alpha-beta hydrolase superfamily lysophospholipase